MNKKPRLGFSSIWNMCFGFMGIQFGFALQNGNVSRIFQTLGAAIDDIPILWIAAPVTGLLVQPIIGYFSDRTWNAFGRRRPYFFWGAVLSTLSLIIMPNSPALWVAALTLWLMDASFNVSMEPFRAFVGDMLPEEQRTTGFAMQSFFIGIGAVVASALPYAMSNWWGISNTAAAGVIPDSVLYSFYAGGVVLFLSVMWTVFSTKEYSPEQLRAFEQAENKQPAPAETEVSGIQQIIRDFKNMPGTMKQLATVQFFSWLALFSMWIYSTPAVTAFHFGSTDPTSALYNEGADWVGILFATYNGFAAIAAIASPLLARKTSRRMCHMMNLCIGGLGLISFLFISEPTQLVFSMVAVGIAWASILSMPYAILSGSLPAEKMGVYMGIFNFFIVIPQILAAAILGFVVKTVFGGEAIYALVFGGVCMIIAGLFTLKVSDDASEDRA
jgi:maltose/moltooligosaccharide transporter